MRSKENLCESGMLRDILNNIFGTHQTYIVGRATTALYLSLLDIKRNYPFTDKKILMPVICCPEVLRVVLHAGFEPIFYDLNRQDLSLSLEEFRNKYNRTKVKVLLLANIFGCISDMDKILSFCKEQNIILIEDLAQSFGGEWKGKALGQFGDYVITSFSHVKILKGSAGGLSMRHEFDNNLLYEDIEKLHEWDPAFSGTWEKNRNYFHYLYGEVYGNANADVTKNYREEINNVPQSYLFKHPDTSLKEESSSLLNYKIDSKHRKRVASIFRKQLNKDFFQIPEIREGSNYWRLPLFLKKGNKNILISKVQEKGFLISSHYFPLDKLYLNHFSLFSRFCFEKILNVWVDEKITENKAFEQAELLNLLSKEQFYVLHN